MNYIYRRLVNRQTASSEGGSTKQGQLIKQAGTRGKSSQDWFYYSKLPAAWRMLLPLACAGRASCRRMPASAQPGREPGL